MQPADVSDNGEPVPVAKNGHLELETPIGVSVRHVHLCQEHVEILFGKGHDLSVYNELYQKGYYAAREQVMVVGRKRCIEKVRVLGPTRPYSQVELSQTDALVIGMKLPIATNGADPACQPITIVGPVGAVTLPGNGGGGAFIARRHIHMSDVMADKLGVEAGDLLDLHIDGPRPTTLHDILVRVKAGWFTEVHLDTDEGNAVGVRSGQTGTIIVPKK
ncbi:MAG: phosphate propanoyltransferase [Chloroflexi bacterium]|nr:MAG: phosphate propanoyltransferase [Chloroflexota bacterium]PIE79890.1 MAG: phosphate propanoyltransferase [Chloroflexota bacterium]